MSIIPLDLKDDISFFATKVAEMTTKMTTVRCSISQEPEQGVSSDFDPANAPRYSWISCYL